MIIFIRNFLVFCSAIVVANWILWWVALPLIFWKIGYGIDVFVTKTFSPKDLFFYVLASVFPPALLVGLVYAVTKDSCRWLRVRFTGSLLGSVTSIWLFIFYVYYFLYSPVFSRLEMSMLPVYDQCGMFPADDFCKIVSTPATAIVVIVLSIFSGVFFTVFLRGVKLNRLKFQVLDKNQ